MSEQSITKRQSTFPLFTKYFTTHPLNVVQYSHQMRKQMDDFIDAFKKRIEVENTYAKSLLQVSKALDKYIKPGTQLSISFICSAFKVEHQQRSRQANQLSQSLKTQIQTLCTQMMKGHTTFVKKMEKDVKKYYKQAENCLQNYQSSLEHFEGISREMEEMIITKNIMRFTTGIPQDKKVKLISKTMESIKNNKEYQKLYLGSVKDYNTFVTNYNKEITTQLEQAETNVRQQVVMQADCLRKLIVAEVSMFKNIQYDLLNISKQMEHLDTQKEIQIFVDQHKNSTQNKIIKQQQPQKIQNQQEQNKKQGTTQLDTQSAYALKPKKIIGKSLLSQSLLYVQQEYFNYMMTNKKNKKLRELLGKIWKDFKKQNAQKIVNMPENVKKPEQILEKIKQNTETTEEVDNPDKTLNEGIDGTDNKIDNQLKSQQPNMEISVSAVQYSWSGQLKQLINQFKVMQPPVFIFYSEKTQKKAAPEIIQDKFTFIVKTIAQVWNNQEIQEQAANSMLKELEEILAIHHLYRLVAFMFIEEYRLQHEVVIKSNLSARTCSKVIKAVVKQSQKSSDIFIIRGILGLIFTFYWNEEKNKKLLFLSPEIYNLEVWKKHDFWQAAIFETTFEEMSLFTYQKNETASETVLRQKNIIFSQLASYCHYMVMLGITTKNVRLIVGRYCRLYEMTEQQNKDLSKMITNTQKQYKQAGITQLSKQKERNSLNQ